MKVLRCSQIVSASLLLSILFLISCSGTTKKATDQNKSEASSGERSSAYPSWYSAGKSVVQDSAGFRGYATALAADSADAVQKALVKARTELKAGVSEALESVRSSAVKRSGSKSGLNNPSFIIALRNAENTIPEAAGTGESSVEKNRSYTGYRAFVEVSIDWKSVIAELDKSLSGEDSWRALKESPAFSEF